MWKCETEVCAFFICRLVRLQDAAALASSWTHICGHFISCTCKDHILFVYLMEEVYNKIEGSVKDILYLYWSQPPCLSQSGEPPISSVYSVLCSVSSRMLRNLENHPGRPLTILPRSSRAPALAPWFLVAASIWKKKAAEATLVWQGLYNHNEANVDRFRGRVCHLVVNPHKNLQTCLCLFVLCLSCVFTNIKW